MSHNSYNYVSNNTNKFLLSDGFISSVALSIKNYLQRNLSNAEKVKIIKFIKKQNQDLLEKHPIDTVRDFLAKSIITEFNNFRCNPKVIDIREMQKQQIGVTEEEGTVKSASDSTNIPKQIKFSNLVDVNKVFGQNTAAGLRKIINPNAAISTNYLLLDTRWRLLTNNGTTMFMWNHVNNAVRQQGSVNTAGIVRDIVQLRLYPIRLPYIASADNAYKRITILIEEFAAQSFIAQENRRFHFIMKSSTDGRWIDLDPQNYNDGYFRFGKPITQIDTLSISFGTPLENMVFDADRLNCTFPYEIGSTYYNPMRAVFTEAHNLSTGDLVYFEDFTSGNILVDNTIINSMNSSAGHLITVINTLTIEIDDINGTTVTTPTAGLTITCYFGSKRIFLPLEVRFIQPDSE